MSELESLDLKNLHVIVLQEFQTEEIQELNTDFFRNLSTFIGNLKNEEYDGIENKTKTHMITIATSLTELLINKRLEKMSSESSYSILTDEEKFIFDSNDEMNERKDMIISGIINGKSKFHSAEVDSETDHRVAMSLAIASLLAKGTSKIMRADAASVSYPTFWEELAKLTN